ncbi:MAG: type I methionyl aminopeptidase [Candidatus Colwellbacteria bacterium]|nr:type I methionyl aminopeptidase [Candidatus Colwellbacteria bacterium]
MALIKSPEQIEKIKRSARILAFTLRTLQRAAGVGINLLELEELARKKIENAGGRPAFLGYLPDGAKRPFPFALCISLNDTIVHGQPHNYALQNGDLLKLDLGINWHGGISDAALTVPIGRITEQEKKLIRTTREALYAGIKAARPRNTLGDIGYAIEKTVRRAGFAVVNGLTGHGVGIDIHEEPAVYNFGEPREGMELRPGMVLALEPMTAMGGPKIQRKSDDSYATLDGSKSAHFEHTILITKGRPAILTR